MLDARWERSGDSPSSEAGAVLQQSRTGLQSTSGGISTGAPQQAGAGLSQQELQSAGLRVGDSQTIISSSSSSRSQTTVAGTDFTALWLLIIVGLFAVGAWLWVYSRKASLAVAVETDALEDPFETDVAAEAVSGRGETESPTDDDASLKPDAGRKKKTAKRQKRRKRR
ncbi:hypothetical protein CR970_00440 [Candidatus Saccharibacteria bacterium]|nr:MAG: hypothetical protein CR970_00440 [Candidatus Saccharibacteria bacterium]